MANTRGKTAIHGPTATGAITTTSPAGSYANVPGAGPHGVGTPNAPTGSGATGGNRTTITPGAKAPTGGRAGNPTSGVPAGLDAGQKTTINTPGKTASYGSGNGVGANTPVKRKKPRRLGTNMGNTPA